VEDNIADEPPTTPLFSIGFVLFERRRKKMRERERERELFWKAIS